MKTFKLIFTLAIALMLIAPVSDSFAAKPDKQAKKEMKKKAYKKARKEARKFRKKGWFQKGIYRSGLLVLDQNWWRKAT